MTGRIRTTTLALPLLLGLALWHSSCQTWQTRSSSALTASGGRRVRRGAAGLDADGPADAPDGRHRGDSTGSRRLALGANPHRHRAPHWRAAAGQAGASGYVLKDDLLEVRRRVEEAS